MSGTLSHVVTGWSKPANRNVWRKVVAVAMLESSAHDVGRLVVVEIPGDVDPASVTVDVIAMHQ